ncbi:MAG: diaminopimelate epimerase [Chloroflexota bacterium]
MTTMEFTKMQASGNDFVIIRSSDSRRNWARLAPLLCHRRLGVGADGVLVVSPSRKADLKVRVMNPDGSEAEICGNGLICLGKYAVQAGVVEPICDEMTVETQAGVRKLKLLNLDGKVKRVSASMGQPRFRPDEIPVLAQRGGGPGDGAPILDHPLFVVNRKLSLAFVSMGNPHAVLFTTKPLDDFPLSRLGPVVENHPIFPQRVNFEVARVLTEGRIEAKVWERGVGETMSCGSGACAIAVAARLHGYVGNYVDVELPGGMLNVEWDGEGDVVLTGSAELVFTGTWHGAGG